MDITPDDTKTLQKIQLLALLEVKRICDKHHIEYFLMYGSLLGAVRHNGFIPWDSDVDVGMLRCNYNRFIEACKIDLSPLFFLQTHESDPAYVKSMIRLCVNDTKYVFRGMEHVEMHQGIFVDIFPIDQAPKQKLLQLYQYILILWWKPATLLKCNYISIPSQGLFKMLCYMVYLLPFVTINDEKMYQKMDSILQKYNVVSSPYLLSGYGIQLVSYVNGMKFTKSETYSRNCYEKHYFTDLINMEFEGHFVSCPRRYHEILSKIYGDYMTPPPIDKQKPLDSIVCLEFNKYSDPEYLQNLIDRYK